MDGMLGVPGIVGRDINDDADVGVEGDADPVVDIDSMRIRDGV